MSIKKVPIGQIEFVYKRAKTFLNCAHCMDEIRGTTLSEHMTPKEYAMLEASAYMIAPADGGKKIEIMVIWCKRCGRPVWDSREVQGLLKKSLLIHN